MNLVVPGMHDIHLPPSPGWWPPAPGWWMLAAVAIAALAWVSLRFLRVRRRARRLAVALREFDAALAAGYDRPTRVAAASALLRRAARLRHPLSAALEGQAWLRFLDGGDPAQPFSQGPGAVLADGAFRRSVDVDVEPALALARARFAVLFVGEPAGQDHA